MALTTTKKPIKLSEMRTVKPKKIGTHPVKEGDLVQVPGFYRHSKHGKRTWIAPHTRKRRG